MFLHKQFYKREDTDKLINRQFIFLEFVPLLYPIKPMILLTLKGWVEGFIYKIQISLNFNSKNHFRGTQSLKLRVHWGRVSLPTFAGVLRKFEPGCGKFE